LKSQGEKGRETIAMIESQHELVAFLTKLAQEVKVSREPRARRAERLRSTLAAAQKSVAGNMFGGIGAGGVKGVRLNMNPNVVATGFYTEDAEIFKSAMMPLGVSFLTHVPQPDVNAADRIQYK
jgi:hypothetical protein